MDPVGAAAFECTGAGVPPEIACDHSPDPDEYSTCVPSDAQKGDRQSSADLVSCVAASDPIRWMNTWNVPPLAAEYASIWPSAENAGNAGSVAPSATGVN